MARVFNRERTWLDPVLRPDRAADLPLDAASTRRTRCAGPNTPSAMLLFSLVSMLVLYLMQRLQQWLPLNPQGFGGGAAGPRVQHRGLVHDQHELAGVRRRDDDELSHADGRARVPQLRLGGGRHRAGDRVHPRHRAREKDTLGNFWVDMVRCALWVLLPFCLVGALVLVSQGVVQNLRPYDTVAVVDPQTVTTPDATASRRRTVVTEQVIAQGPVASQEIIKEFGTNGGGFFNANSAHPFENPTPLSNFIEMFCDLRDLGRAHLHARPDDRIAAARLGGLGARWRSCSWPASRPPTGPRRAATRC